MGSSEDKNEISEDVNLALVDYGFAYPIVVVMKFMASTKDGVPTTLNQLGSKYFIIYMRNIFKPELEGTVITVWLESLKVVMGPNFTVMHNFPQFFNQLSKNYLFTNTVYRRQY